MAMRIAILCLDQPWSYFTVTSLAYKEIVPKPKDLERETFNISIIQACMNLIPRQEATDTFLKPFAEEV